MKYPNKMNLGLGDKMKLVVEAMANLDGRSQQEVIRAAIAGAYSLRTDAIDKEIQHIEYLRKTRERGRR